MNLNIQRRGTRGWSRARELAIELYARHHGADVRPDPDFFVTLEEGGILQACAGATYARTRRTYADYYTRHGVFSAIAERFGREVADDATIIEIGPLASAHSGAGAQLISVLAAIGWTNGADFIVCTITAPLRRLLGDLGIAFVAFGPARLEALPPEMRDSWGSYYDTSPICGYVDVRGMGHDQLELLTEGAARHRTAEVAS